MKKQSKQIICRLTAMLLASAMLVGMMESLPQAAKELALNASSNNQQVSSKTPNGDKVDRDQLENIVDILDGTVNTGSLSDETLKDMADDLLNKVDKNGQSTSVDAGSNKDAYDETGAMTKPFDQVYPDAVEKGQVKYDDESLLVKLSNSMQGKASLGMTAAGIVALEPIVPLEKATWYEAKLAEGTDAMKALEALRKLSEVLLAEYNYQIQTAQLDHYKDLPGDRDFDKNGHKKDQWYLHHCGIPDGFESMETNGGSSSVIVAVIDTGVDIDHEDLKDNIWVNTAEIPGNGVDDDSNGYIDDYYGVNIVSGEGNGDDDNGHGTHVAGIIAAQNNNLGTVGIAYNTTIMPVKAAMASGNLNQSDIAKAVLYAYEHGAEVINMSFGGEACSIAVQDALAVAYTRCVLVASAGNDGAKNEGLFAIPNYPAALSYVLGVMSVDQNGVESVFTNWDVNAFNGVEYELYAPGEDIMSTLPGDRYGKLSGTSMAAPVVSAMAAILRSEFSNRDTYPTKFIYGQLASTSGYNATCLNPEKHCLHNLPQIVNLHAALTNLPKPEVGLQDYAAFDTTGFSYDVDGKNNGDGVIDAGETIALGLTLRNRWGMSENTKVTIDTLSMAGIPDPYITIHNPTVNYGSVGTYSTQDAGKVFTDELLTGWENPFYITIAKNCPNDYIFTLNVTISCENALDESDTTKYEWSSSKEDFDPVTLTVRNGVLIAGQITEDQTWTKDNLYIIYNGTIINEGVTVTVEPGTNIQFWSSDASDPYADQYVAYLKVNGKFLVNGTKEEPVYIYPSDLMWNYMIEITEGGSGYISLTYADITNLGYVVSNASDGGSHISYAEHCTFRMSTDQNLLQRYISDGQVAVMNAMYGKIAYFTYIRDSIFNHIPRFSLEGYADRCIFADCGLAYGEDFEAKDCVFLGNNYADQSNPDSHWTSSINIPRVEFDSIRADQFKVFVREETGTTYVVGSGLSEDQADIIAELIQRDMGGHYAIFENQEEIDWLYQAGLKDIDDEYGYITYRLGIQYDQKNAQCVWSDGSLISEDLVIEGNVKNNVTLIGDSLHYTYSIYEYADVLFEINGDVLPKEIFLAKYHIDIDLDSTFQLLPMSAPVAYPSNMFIYESKDETVVTISDTGLITPVGQGSADIYVYSVDRAVYTYVTVTVMDYVPLQSIHLLPNTLDLAVGETAVVKCIFTPENTTRSNVTYTSSDESVVTIDSLGIVTAIGKGNATITASCDGLTATMPVTVSHIETDYLTLEKNALVGVLSDGVLPLPLYSVSAGSDVDLAWSSSDDTVATVQNGELVLKKAGATVIRVVDQYTNYTDSLLLIVQESKPSAIKKIELEATSHYVLLEDGSLYYWDKSLYMQPYLVSTEVKDFSATNLYALVLFQTGTIQRIDFSMSTPSEYDPIHNFEGTDVAGVVFDWDSYYVYTTSGSVYAWGNNGRGELGLGNSQSPDSPQLIMLENVVDVYATDETAYFLCSNGDLYVAGSNYYYYSPVLAAQNISQLFRFSGANDALTLTTEGNTLAINLQSMETAALYSHHADLDVVEFNWGLSQGVGIKNGKVYLIEIGNNERVEVPDINNATNVYTYYGTHYVVTADNLLYALGNNGDNDAAGFSNLSSITTPVIVFLEALANEELVITYNNLSGEVNATEPQVLTDEHVEFVFNKELCSATPKLYLDGLQVVATANIVNRNYLYITRSSFSQEGIYTLVFEAGSIRAAGGICNTEEISFTFTYVPTSDDGVTEEETHPSQIDSSIDRYYTAESFNVKLHQLQDAHQYHPDFNGNAILNHISTDTNVDHWLRPVAPYGEGIGEGFRIPLGGNHWGTTNETAIGLQLVDAKDFLTYAQLMYAPYLTEAPENTFPFVTGITILNKAGEAVTTVGNEEISVRITFNRDMDTSIDLQVRFGSAYPYGDYEISGSYVDARTWEGTYTLSTIIENGNQFFTISNGCSATDDLVLCTDQARFGFVIDTTAAQALVMQGEATDTGIKLTWTQDDFDTLMGYNVYRSDSEDGFYTRLNGTVIPADVMEFFDDTVEPGKQYYYNFTVVQTDLSESIPSGKITIMSKDTMAPNIYHSPVTNSTTGSNLVISATVTDNLHINYAWVYYRVAGSDNWSIAVMNNLNDKFSAIIPAANVTTAGLEYYVAAFDGVSYTYKGSAENPYVVTVQDAVGSEAMGDVNGDGKISNLDAMLLLQARNDLINLNAEQFARADLDGSGKLDAFEALRILQYVSGVVGSVDMRG